LPGPVGPRGPQGEPGSPGISKEDLEQVSKLVNEFRPELERIWGEIDKIKERLDALEAKAPSQTQAPVTVTQTVNVPEDHHHNDGGTIAAVAVAAGVGVGMAGKGHTTVKQDVDIVVPPVNPPVNPPPVQPEVYTKECPYAFSHKQNGDLPSVFTFTGATLHEVDEKIQEHLRTCPFNPANQTTATNGTGTTIPTNPDQPWDPQGGGPTVDQAFRFAQALSQGKTRAALPKLSLPMGHGAMNLRSDGRLEGWTETKGIKLGFGQNGDLALGLKGFTVQRLEGNRTVVSYTGGNAHSLYRIGVEKGALHLRASAENAVRAFDIHATVVQSGDFRVQAAASFAFN